MRAWFRASISGTSRHSNASRSTFGRRRSSLARTTQASRRSSQLYAPAPTCSFARGCGSWTAFLWVREVDSFSPGPPRSRLPSAPAPPPRPPPRKPGSLPAGAGGRGRERRSSSPTSAAAERSERASRRGRRGCLPGNDTARGSGRGWRHQPHASQLESRARLPPRARAPTPTPPPANLVAVPSAKAPARGDAADTRHDRAGDPRPAAQPQPERPSAPPGQQETIAEAGEQPPNGFRKVDGVPLWGDSDGWPRTPQEHAERDAYYSARRDLSQADRYDYNTVVRYGGQTAAEKRVVRQEQTRSR